MKAGLVLRRLMIPLLLHYLVSIQCDLLFFFFFFSVVLVSQALFLYHNLFFSFFTRNKFSSVIGL